MPRNPTGRLEVNGVGSLMAGRLAIQNYWTLANLAVDLARLGGRGSTGSPCRRAETRRGRELHSRICRQDHGRLLKSWSESELTGGEVLGAAAVGDVDGAVQDLNVQTWIESGGGGRNGILSQQQPWTLRAFRWRMVDHVLEVPRVRRRASTQPRCARRCHIGGDERGIADGDRPDRSIEDEAIDAARA